VAEIIYFAKIWKCLIYESVLSEDDLGIVNWFCSIFKIFANGKSVYSYHMLLLLTKMRGHCELVLFNFQNICEWKIGLLRS